jgi:hypothetical protein
MSKVDYGTPLASKLASVGYRFLVGRTRFIE